MFSVQKKNIDIKHAICFDINGGESISFTSREYVLGSTYETFPSVTKTDYICSGFFTDPQNGTKIKVSDEVDFRISRLYAHYAKMTNFTSFQIDITDSHKTFGFYSATKKTDSKAIFVDWGDGNVEEVDSDISQLYHTYVENGTFTVKVSDDVSALCVSNSSSTYYEKIRYTLKKILTYSTSLTSIPQYCYYYAYYLNEIKADLSNISSIGSHAFYYCYYLPNLSWLAQTKVTSLPTYCFYYCYTLNSLSGCSKITSVGSYCFYYCKNIKNFTGLGNIPKLDSYSFYQSGITSLDTLPNSVTAFYQQCLGYTTVSDLSRVRTTDYLGSYCFACMNSLTSLETLSPRSSLPTYCFYYCTGLKYADMSNWTNLTYLPNNCFDYASYLKEFKAPSSLTGIGTYAFRYNYYGQLTADFSESQITSIGNYDFYYSYGLKEIRLPNTLKYIGQYAFYYSYNYLTSICLPSSLTGIEQYAFQYCKNLGKISCLAQTAPTVQSSTFGSSTTYATGRNTYSAGTNTLYLIHPSTGYDSSYWNSKLLNSSYCGFHIEYLNNTYQLSDCSIQGLSCYYLSTGTEIIPDISVYNNKKELIQRDVDYSYVLQDNVQVGTAKLSAIGIGDYSGFLSSSFRILSTEPSMVELEYIEFVGNQYIDTGIIPTNHYTEIKYFVPTYVNDGHILGTTYGAGYYNWTEYNNGTQKYFWGRNGSESNGGSWSSAQHVVQMNYGSNYQVILDGTILGSGYTIYSGNNLYIGRRDSTANFKGYIYYCKIYDKSSDSLIRDFIPVKDIEGKACMYDKVSEEYYYDANGNEFIAGPEKTTFSSSSQKPRIFKTELSKLKSFFS